MSQQSQSGWETAPALFGARIALLYSALFFFVGIYLPFFPLWLSSRGLDATSISLVLAAPLVARIATSGQITAFADRASDRANVLIFLFCTAAIIVSLFPFVSGFWAILAVALALSIATNPLTPVMDSLTLSGVRRFGASYGRIRLWGSLVFILANLGGGAVLAGYDAETVLWVMIASAFAGAALSPLLPRIGRPRRQVHGIGPGSASLLRLPRFTLVMLASGLLQASHAMIYGFGSIHWGSIGYSGTLIGLLWAIGVIVEIVLFHFAAAVFQKVSPFNLVVIGAFGSMMRWGLMPLEPPLAGYVFLQMLHGLSFGAVHLGTMHFLAAEIPDERMGAAQGIAFVLGGAVMAVAVLMSGPLYAAFGVAAFLAMAAMSVLSIILLAIVAGSYPQSLLEGGETRDVE
ncbi:MAG: MFS transporter [Nitratireductor sp.]